MPALRRVHVPSLPSSPHRDATGRKSNAVFLPPPVFPLQERILSPSDRNQRHRIRRIVSAFSLVSGKGDTHVMCKNDLVCPSRRGIECASELESNVELDSDGYVTWECFDTLPETCAVGETAVNLFYRPAFFPDEGIYRAVADGDFDSFMVEWTGTAERCEWKNPSRIITLDEYNAENVGNAHLMFRRRC